MMTSTLFRENLYFITLISCISFLDLFTTGIAEYFGGTELNPLPASLGFTGTIILRVTTIFFIVFVAVPYIAKYSDKHPGLTDAAIPAMYCSISALWLAAVFNNIATIAIALK